jgi:4-hydroxybenzoate polyprenyltransferase
MFLHIKKYASLVRFAHTVYALPFALIAFAMALITTSLEHPWLLLLQVLGCMVTARNSAMSFNRYADRFIDGHNERTKMRELPSGKLSPKSVVLFFLANVALFLAIAWSIHTLCFWLAFPALALLCGYSYTKRFTWLCHFVLGMALSIAPAGAYIAVTGVITVPVLWLSLMVLLWVAGFDIRYALPDELHDRTHGLHSIPQRFGRRGALWISGGVHALALAAMVAFGVSGQFGVVYWVGAALFGGIIMFRGANGVASVVFGVMAVVDLVVRV